MAFQPPGDALQMGAACLDLRQRKSYKRLLALISLGSTVVNRRVARTHAARRHGETRD